MKTARLAGGDDGFRQFKFRAQPFIFGPDFRVLQDFRLEFFKRYVHGQDP